jgi:phage terminase large subunit
MNEIELSLKINKTYGKLLEDDLYRFEILYGGAGSGKSYAACQYIIARALASPRRKFLCLRKVARTLRFSVFALLIEVINNMGAEKLFKINRSELTIECVYSGAFIMCMGMDDPEKLKSIFGVTDVFMEEASEFTYEDFKQINLRVRGGREKKKIILAFNPINALLWIKDYFFDHPKHNARITHTTYTDNVHIDEEYKQELMNLEHVDRYFYEVYTLGKWGILGNNVFHNFVIENFGLQEDDFDMNCFGMDYGFNHASVMLKIGFYDGELYIWDELYRKKLTNPELIREGKRFDPAYREHFYSVESAEPDRLKEFRQEGWMVDPAKKGKDSVKQGIDYLKRFKIHVHEKRCPNTAREIRLYKYRETRDGQVLDEPVEIEDDTIAALRYAVEPLWRNTTRWRPVA